MKKRILSILLAISIAVGAMGTAAAVYTTQINVDPDISVTMGGKDVALEDVNGKAVDPMYIDGTIYLPIRAISETVGYDVQWDGGTKTVVIGEPVEVESVVANCTSEPYGKAVHSFTFHVNSTQSVMNLTAEDFQCSHFVYDGNEVHKPFDAKALDVSFTQDTVTVEVEPFYPDMSFTREGYWTITCTNPAFNVNPATELTYSDPVVEAFENFELTYGEGEDAARMDCYLYTPENADDGPLPIVIFNSGGTGVSTTGDLYGANFAVSFAKEESQNGLPCYVFYPQRNEGSTENLIDCIKEYVDQMVADGKVDANRIYMTGESAGTSFTVNFIDRHPGWNTAIAIFAGGGMSDECIQKQVDAGTKIMFIPCLGDTTANPVNIAPTYQKLVELGMEPGVEVVWHYYTANDFNALLGDNTYWEFVQDAEYVTDPVNGDLVKTYNYPEGKLHNDSYPGANDTYIKTWLFNQSKEEFTAERSENYSAQYTAAHTDYSIIPDQYTKVAHLEDVPGVPAGTTGPMTVYTNETEDYFYLEFKLNPPLDGMHPDPQYVEAVIVGTTARVIMDCSGSWWTADINNSTLPYLMSIMDTIDWQPYTH